MRAHRPRMDPARPDPPTFKKFNRQPFPLPLAATFRALLREPGCGERPPAPALRGAAREDFAQRPEGVDAAALAAARPERPTRAVDFPEAREPSAPRAPLADLAVEQFLVLPDARAVRLKLGGRAGAPSVEVEVTESDGELSVAIGAEDGDRRRAEAWARRVERALARRGLRGHVTSD